LIQKIAYAGWITRDPVEFCADANDRRAFSVAGQIASENLRATGKQFTVPVPCMTGTDPPPALGAPQEKKMGERVLLLTLFGWLATASLATAQIREGDVRLSLDSDMISIAGVEVEDGSPGGESEYMVFGIGPNQLGSSRLLIPTTPLGLGLGYVVSPKIVLGLRFGFGVDILSRDGADENEKVLALSLMPGLTFVPIGRSAKLFITLSPLFQVERVSDDDASDRLMRGGFSAGMGTLIGVGGSSTVDLGFFFEGRFGSYEPEDGAEIDVRDLRGVVRLGFSLWK
jgi:hypothetical protein